MQASDFAQDQNFSGKQPKKVHLRFGPAVRQKLMLETPVRLLLMSAEWWIFFHTYNSVTSALEWEICVAILRLYRLYDLWQYFSSREADVATDIRWAAAFKFTFIIFTTVCASQNTKIP